MKNLGINRSMMQDKNEVIQSFVVIALILFFIGGCNLKDSIETVSSNWRTTVENSLNDSIDSLNNTSSDWKNVLGDLQENLPKEVQSTIRVEVGNLVSRSISQGGVELRCDADFLRNRVRQTLERILAKFLGRTMPILEPAICQVVPITVDRSLVPSRITQIEFYGYDFDHPRDLKVFHVRSNGRQDVTAKLDRPTHYAMTLKFGANGVQLDNKTERFILEWGGRQISTIAVIQPEIPACRKKIDRFSPTPVTYMPPKRGGGDGDFKGHGPTISTTVTLLIGQRSIKAKVQMNAFESKSNNRPKRDHTTAKGTENFPLYSPPPNFKIIGVLGAKSTSHKYRDSGHSVDSFGKGSGGPVKRFVFVGDTRGNEAGTRTKVDITFNRLTIELLETGNCIPPSH